MKYALVDENGVLLALSTEQQDGWLEVGDHILSPHIGLPLEQ